MHLCCRNSGHCLVRNSFRYLQVNPTSQTNLHRYQRFISHFNINKRAGVSQIDLKYYYETVIRPVLEYACPVWHHSLTNEQCKKLEAIQSGCQITVGSGKYNDNCVTLNWTDSMWDVSSNARTYLCEFYIDLNIVTLFAAHWTPSISHIGRLRSAKKFPRLFTRTNSFKNSVNRHTVVCVCDCVCAWLLYNPAFRLPNTSSLNCWYIIYWWKTS